MSRGVSDFRKEKRKGEFLKGDYFINAIIISVEMAMQEITISVGYTVYTYATVVWSCDQYFGKCKTIT